MVLVHKKVLRTRQPLACLFQKYMYCPSKGGKLHQPGKLGVKGSLSGYFQKAAEVNNRVGMPSSHWLQKSIIKAVTHVS